MGPFLFCLKQKEIRKNDKELRERINLDRIETVLRRINSSRKVMKGGAEIDDYTTDVFNWFFLTEVVTQKKS